jgi:hypothetical protein
MVLRAALTMATSIFSNYRCFQHKLCISYDVLGYQSYPSEQCSALVLFPILPAAIWSGDCVTEH